VITSQTNNELMSGSGNGFEYKRTQENGTLKEHKSNVHEISITMLFTASICEKLD